jgi:hypothetical protein
LTHVVASQVKATNYYFSNAGKDSNKGTSAKAPWQNIAKLDRIKLQPGDSILLKRGDTFPGTIQVKTSGTNNRPIVISAYGAGAPPVLTGALKIKGWKQQSGVFAAQSSRKVSDLYVDDVRQTLARYPNRGFMTIDSGLTRQTILSRDIQRIPGDVTGAFVRIRSINWAYETRLCKAATKQAIHLVYHQLYKEDPSVLPRTEHGKKTLYELRKGFGFYVDGLPQLIDTAGEWSMSGKQVLFKPQPQWVVNEHTLEATVENTGIGILPNVKNIVVAHIQMEKYFYAALDLGARTENITVNDCRIKNTTVFGIRMDSLSTHCQITNNAIHNVLGTGLSAVEPENLLVENNQVTRIGLVPGQGLSGINAASGIVIYNHEPSGFHEGPPRLKPRYANHNQIRLNRIDSCGYTGGRVDGSYNVVEYNVIANCGLTLNDGAAFYCFAQQPGITHHLVMRRNIIRNARGNNEATPAEEIAFNGIYIDNNSHDMLVEENTSMDHSSNGITNNDGSFDNSYIRNNIFNCNRGIDFAEWHRLGRTYGSKVSYNTVAAIEESQRLVSDVNYIANKTNFATYDYNQYIHTASTNPFYKETRQIPRNSRLYLSFADWQEIGKGNQDTHATALLADSDLLKDFAPQILVNETLVDKEYTFGQDQYRDSRGEKFANPVKLGAYQSIIVLKKK